MAAPVAGRGTYARVVTVGASCRGAGAAGGRATVVSQGVDEAGRVVAAVGCSGAAVGGGGVAAVRDIAVARGLAVANGVATGRGVAVAGRGVAPSRGGAYGQGRGAAGPRQQVFHRR